MSLKKQPSQRKKAEITQSLASKYFDLEFDSEKGESFLDGLTHEISIKIKFLLDRDLQTLINIFYRIDVSEDSFNEVVHNSPPENVSDNLAKLVVERFIQKAEFRMKWSEA